MTAARAKKPQPQSGTRPSKRWAASDAPLEAAKAYVTLTEGKEYELGGLTSRRTSDSERKGLGCIMRFFSTSEEINLATKATNPASAAQRPVLPPSAASTASNTTHTNP